MSDRRNGLITLRDNRYEPVPATDLGFTLIMLETTYVDGRFDQSTDDPGVAE